MPRDSILERVMTRTGATYRQIDHWCRKGYLLPGTPGSGFYREWSEKEIQITMLMVKLTAAGIPPKIAEQVARAGGNLEIAPGIWIIVGQFPNPRK